MLDKKSALQKKLSVRRMFVMETIGPGISTNELINNDNDIQDEAEAENSSRTWTQTILVR